VSAPELQQLDAEMRLEHRLKDHGVQPLYGVSTTAQRRAAARAAILVHGLAAVVCFKDAKPITYAEAFELTYGEPLVPTAPPAEAPSVQMSATDNHQGKLL
jgi:hypothetical protein